MIQKILLNKLIFKYQLINIDRHGINRLNDYLSLLIESKNEHRIILQLLFDKFIYILTNIIYYPYDYYYLFLYNSYPYIRLGSDPHQKSYRITKDGVYKDYIEMRIGYKYKFTLEEFRYKELF